MKGIIVTHPNGKMTGFVYGIEYNKLVLLAEFRAKNKGTIKPRFKTIEAKDEISLQQKAAKLGVTNAYKMTDEQYKHELQTHF